MPKILTVRPSRKEQNDIVGLMDFYSVGHASKALLLAAKELPELHNAHNILKEQYEALLSNYNDVITLVKQREEIDSSLRRVIADKKI